MNSFKITGHGEIRSDETSEYFIEVSPEATVNQVLVDIVNQEHEHGFIGIKDENNPFHGAYSFEYENGKSEIPSEEVKAFWKSVKHRKVIGIKANGGWGCTDYILELGE